MYSLDELKEIIALLEEYNLTTIKMSDKTVNQLEEVEHFSYVLVADGNNVVKKTVITLASEDDIVNILNDNNE